MAEDKVQYLVAEGAEQCASWKSKIETFMAGAKPDGFALTGSAASKAQDALDRFSTKVYNNFEDNTELAVVIHDVMVGHHEAIVEQDQKGGELR